MLLLMLAGTGTGSAPPTFAVTARLGLFVGTIQPDVETAPCP